MKLLFLAFVTTLMAAGCEKSAPEPSSFIGKECEVRYQKSAIPANARLEETYVPGVMRAVSSEGVLLERPGQMVWIPNSAIRSITQSKSGL